MTWLWKGIWHGPAKLSNELPPNVKLSNKIINLIVKTTKTWRVELTVRWKCLAETKILRGIFQGDAVSSLLFVRAMMPLNHILRKYTAGYKLSKSPEQINHLMDMDNIKVFEKKKKNWKLIHTVRIYSQDIGMEFSIEKCTMIIIIKKTENDTWRKE